MANRSKATGGEKTNPTAKSARQDQEGSSSTAPVNESEAGMAILFGPNSEKPNNAEQHQPNDAEPHQPNNNNDAEQQKDSLSRQRNVFNGKSLACIPHSSITLCRLLTV